ncbi:P-loop containing nucleoside triphosphate hydrolase protein [Fennellomyces sp. T-0311]|nr:P-loop containing nucleoside triphosphate hydrolase protein [Fennellomyces sp. T-0311]
MDSNFMRKLNEAQRKAVTCENNAVQILAGPGSGKTRVLTSRVAWLVLSKNENPNSIVVVTFTKKAANEMRQRLQSAELLGPATSDRLVMGTFHSICATMLRRNGSMVDLKKNFTIADTDVSMHIIKKLKKELESGMTRWGNEMKPEAFYSEFSKSRNKGINVDKYIEKYQNDQRKKDLCLMFRAYEDRLKVENMVDFDNLLLFTRKLLIRFPHVANFVSHVLVDEFQDTNSVQYDIIKGLTHSGQKALTIVGDPDQSIYSWRNADRENFIKMQNEYENTAVCNLEENYRSTKSILTAAFHVVNQDRSRIQKSLFTQNSEGVPISMLKMSSDTMEAQSVAEEIKRILEYSGGLITYKDIAVLSRMNYLSRAFEQAFNAAGIPYVVVGGLKFFERAEVKDIIAYLRFFYNPNDTEAFERIINKPKRGVGEVTMNKIEGQSRKKNWNIIRVLESIGQGTAKNITVPVKTARSLHEFVGLYEHIRTMIDRRDPISTMLEHIIEAIEYRTYLTKEHPDKDGESRWDNVGELISYAKTQFDPSTNRQEQAQPEDGENEGLDNNDTVARFLESTTLIGTGKEEEEAELGKVTISTMHSAKGLEWPVVFTVACEAGIIPHPKAEDETEES